MQNEARDGKQATTVQYSRAPIVEAVIDLQLVFESPPSVGDIDQYAVSLKSSFPNKQWLNAFRVAVQTTSDDNGEGNVSTDSSVAPVGVRLSNAANDRVLQFRENGFSYSHLPPYTNWEQFYGEALELFTPFCERFSAQSVLRTAVRYINRVAVPTPCKLETYLQHLPRALPGFPEPEGYFMQVLLPLKDVDDLCKAIVNSGLEIGVANGTLDSSLLLDIDVFVEHPPTVSLGSAWDLLVRLRDKKNELFEVAITDTLREMIK